MSYGSPTNRLPRKSNSSKKLRKPDAKLARLRHELNNFSQKGKSQTLKQNSHKPTNKLSLPRLKQKQKNCESQTNNCATPTKPNKKIKRANSKRHSEKKTHSESRTPTKSCAKKTKGKSPT
jgi:hypothetical protein